MLGALPAVCRQRVGAALRGLDQRLGTSVAPRAAEIRSTWRASPTLNRWRRRLARLRIGLVYRVRGRPPSPVRLHLGCGDRRLQGYVNVDIRKTTAVDVVGAAECLPYPDGAVDRIESYHLVEHLPRHALPPMLREWYRVLRPGGRVVIECPDFDRAVAEYLEGNEGRLDSIFGLQRHAGDAHLFGYNVDRLGRLLAAAGFAEIAAPPARDYHSASEPCLRIECAKPEC